MIEFAELEEFAELKLKNYSSGMLVRLAFSVMIQSDADILLIDEVLAVGDAAFQQKCRDVFHEMRSDRTIILVTHDMSAVEQFCHRAMLLDRGDIQAIGDPDEIAHRYLRLNFAENTGAEHEAHPVAPEGAELLLLDAWLECDGERTDNIEQGRELTFHAIFEAPTEIPGPSFGFVIVNAEAVEVGGFHVGMEHSGDDHPDVLAAGERLHMQGEALEPLHPGPLRDAVLGVSQPHARRAADHPAAGPRLRRLRHRRDRRPGLDRRRDRARLRDPRRDRPRRPEVGP